MVEIFLTYLKDIIYNNIIMTQYILTEEEYKEFLKLQEKKEKIKNYYREYELNKYYNVQTYKN